MKRHIAGLLFILLFLTFFFGINALYIEKILPRTIEYRSDVDVHNLTIRNLHQYFPEKQIQYAFFGDSHTAHAVNPAYISGAYNFARPERMVRSSPVRLQQLLEDWRLRFTIDTMVLEFDVQTYRLQPEEKIHDIPLDRNDLISKKFMEKPRLYWLGFMLRTHVPFIGNGEYFSFLTQPPKKKVPDFGWVAAHGNLSTVGILGSHIAERYGNLTRMAPVHDEAVQYLVTMLELANKHNITVVFVKYPMSNIYNSFMEKRQLGNYYETLFTVINVTLEQDYYVLDYHDFFADDGMFFDPDHLNAEGATVFSQRLHDDLAALHGLNK